MSVCPRTENPSAELRSSSRSRTGAVGGVKLRSRSKVSHCVCIENAFVLSCFLAFVPSLSWQLIVVHARNGTKKGRFVNPTLCCPSSTGLLGPHVKFWRLLGSSGPIENRWVAQSQTKALLKKKSEPPSPPRLLLLLLLLLLLPPLLLRLAFFWLPELKTNPARVRRSAQESCASTTTDARSFKTTPG
jgi:hypothetical protein